MEENKILYQIETETKTIFDRAINYLNSKYSIRFNTISLEFDIKLVWDKKWSALNLNSLFIELVRSGIDIPINKLETLVRSHLIEQYNPIWEYFDNLEYWDNENHIGKLCCYVKTTDDKSFQKYLEKWLTRSVICALKPGYINKQCFVLFNIKQNSGKTSFLRFLIPANIEQYYIVSLQTNLDILE